MTTLIARRSLRPLATTCDGRPRPRLRGVSHHVAFYLAVPAAIAVALTTQGGIGRAAGTAFAASVVGMFGVSALFHRGSWTPQVAQRLGRLDHAMIYGLIAATYAPIGLLVVHRGWRLPGQAFGLNYFQNLTGTPSAGGAAPGEPRDGQNA